MTKKRKSAASFMGDHEESAARKNSTKRNRSLTIMRNFLEKLSSSCDDTAASTAAIAVLDNNSCSHVLFHAIARCHERFLHVVAAELAAGKDQEKINRVGPLQVQVAMKELGMDSVSHEAAAATMTTTSTAAPSSNKWKRKQERRTKQWSQDEVAQQERLLASSKDKLQQAG